ncbi:MAG: hypothetical protein IPM57_07370 [Oligoflexia bacterium]|nr:hypothetical protein [Oligoflexia bacterium]
MKRYHQFTDEFCELVTKKADKNKNDVDSRLKAAEEVVKEKNYQIYSDQHDLLNTLETGDYEKIFKNAKYNLITYCAKNTRVNVLLRVERAEKKPKIEDKIISYFDADLLDKLNATGATSRTCITAVFKYLDVYNHKYKMQKLENEKHEQLKCIHQQNCGADGKPMRRGQ